MEFLSKVFNIFIFLLPILLFIRFLVKVAVSEDGHEYFHDTMERGCEIVGWIFQFILVLIITAPFCLGYTSTRDRLRNVEVKQEQIIEDITQAKGEIQQEFDHLEEHLNKLEETLNSE